MKVCLRAGFDRNDDTKCDHLPIYIIPVSYNYYIGSLFVLDHT